MKKQIAPKIVTRVRIPVEVYERLWRFVNARTRAGKKVGRNETVSHALRFYLENMEPLVGGARYDGRRGLCPSG